MLNFLENSSDENATSSRLEHVRDMINDIKVNHEIGVKYMHPWDREYHIRKESWEEGREEEITC